jgi:hypothetical protein
MWIKINGPDYENQSAGTKMGFFASALPLNKGGGTQSFLWLSGRGKQGAFSEFNVEVRQETGAKAKGGFNRNMLQNVDRTRFMTCGQWHQWEILFELNTLGQANGVLKWWIDGHLAMDHRDITYIFPNNTNGFWNWKWNPTWGGMKGARTRDDYIYIDHVYLSGVPYDGPVIVGDRRPWDPPAGQ